MRGTAPATSGRSRTWQTKIPPNPNDILGFYDRSRSFTRAANAPEFWNREHVRVKSRGFPSAHRRSAPITRSRREEPALFLSGTHLSLICAPRCRWISTQLPSASDGPRERASEHFVNLPRNVNGLHGDGCPLAEECVVIAIEHDLAFRHRRPRPTRRSWRSSSSWATGSATFTNRARCVPGRQGHATASRRATSPRSSR
jgi:hypothetical protein